MGRGCLLETKLEKDAVYFGHSSVTKWSQAVWENNIKAHFSKGTFHLWKIVYVALYPIHTNPNIIQSTTISLILTV